MKTILLVEDDADIVELIQLFLRNEGYHVVHVDDGAEVIGAVQLNQPDLIIMDIMLPNVDGLTCTQEIRQSFNVPVIMLTALVEQGDKLAGLETGADDYLCKPFDIQELLLRIKALLRRTEGQVHYQPWVIDEEQLTVSFNGAMVDFTLGEFKLFTLLYNAPNRVFSRDQIIELIYADYRDITDRAVDSHIKNLRRKIKQNGADPAHIQSVYGAGYRFNQEPTS
ncbi:response regulator transcription factor [Thalassotalea euphylliae]|uniref:DNA-binding response regulator n=1 Tax=Thalassotalea euphylliae TaxID=1655234 RepID=A0A3E0U1Q4_9GAMM|nr:response regulator transcription factor [Thalassotalea euphylliae]REL30886.1 DNA-binding response regulator [Thalassotalea euphylliae]